MNRGSFQQLVHEQIVEIRRHIESLKKSVADVDESWKQLETTEGEEGPVLDCLDEVRDARMGAIERIMELRGMYSAAAALGSKP